MAEFDTRNEIGWAFSPTITTEAGIPERNFTEGRIFKMTERTPTEYRAILDNWRARNADLSDSEIMPKQRSAASPRHVKIANAVRSLLAWRDIIEPPETLQTNFLQADNDNEPKEENEPGSPKRDVECELEIRPTVNELMAAVSEVKFINGFPDKEDPNVEFGPKKNGVAPFTRIGGLRLNVVSHEQLGSAHRGEILKYRSGGRWYDPRDRLGTAKGPAVDFRNTNDFYCSLLGATPRRNLKASPRDLQRPRLPTNDISKPNLPPTSLSLARAREWCGLSPAPANDNRPALPWQPASARVLFMGGKVAGKTEQAEVYRNDPETRLESLHRATALMAVMSPQDTRILDATLPAGDFKQVGSSLGCRGKNAERRGKRALLEATKNLSKSMKDLAA